MERGGRGLAYDGRDHHPPRECDAPEAACRADGAGGKYSFGIGICPRQVEGKLSTGSGTILDKPGDSKDQWIFDTPRGEFTVQSKLTNPVWVKPDWAFIEEGLKVPTSQADRVEPGVLGEYALGFGKGYFIHGTLYPRLLGKNVTHGCIRLNDDDLKSVYRLAKVGTTIMIF